MSRLGLTVNIGPRVRRVAIALLILAAVVILLLPRQTQDVLLRFGNPVTQLIEIPLVALAEFDRTLRETWNHYLALQGVYEQNQALREQVQLLQGQLNTLREHAVISQELGQLLAFQQTGFIQTVAARVIGYNATNWYRALIINKGQHDGVQNHMGVITHAGVVGRVVKSYPSSSIVLLLTDPNMAVTGLIQRSRDEGIVQGTTHGEVKMKYLPPLSSVKVGDVVVTSGLTGDFPRGLQIGQIQGIDQGDTELFQQASLQPVVDFSKLEGVLVITSSGQAPDFTPPPPSAEAEQGTDR